MWRTGSTACTAPPLRASIASSGAVGTRTRARKPLRRARVTVAEVPGQQQWFRCALAVEPHFSLEGVPVELGLVGKLDRT